VSADECRLGGRTSVGMLQARAASVSAACALALALACLAGGACRGPIGWALCDPTTDESCESLEPNAVVAALRPDMPEAGEAGPAYDPGDTVEHLDSPAFRVHFTRAGRHAAPATDGDRDGTPDFVQDVAEEYEAVRAYYRDELGFLEPLSDARMSSAEGGDGGDARFDVYLLDFGTSSDGAFRAQACSPDAAHRCSGYMLHENDFDGRNYPSLDLATRILASHEYFHAIQAAYHSGAGAVLGEGTAVWASESYDPSLEDLEGFVNGYLARTDRSLTIETTGPVDSFSYGSGLFYQFLSERYDPAIIRELWQALRDQDSDQPSWPEALDQVLSDSHATTLADAFADFTRWNLYTGARSDPAQSYAQGEHYPAVAETALDLPHSDESVRVFPLSARFYSARAGASETFSLTLIPGPDAELSGLQLFLARESRGTITAFERADATQQDTVTLEASAGDTLHAVLLNTRLTGESLRPGVCLGTSDQVAACSQELRGEEAAAPDAGTEADDAGTEPSEEAGPSADSGGCATIRLGAKSLHWSLATLALCGWLLRRRQPQRRASRHR
jgi:hypothetical protein